MNSTVKLTPSTYVKTLYSCCPLFHNVLCSTQSGIMFSTAGHYTSTRYVSC